MRSVKIIKAIAMNTFRETVRDRVLYAIVIFAFLATIAGSVFGSLSADQDLRVLEDLGLCAISLFGGVIALFIGTTLVYKEIDRRTIYLIVTKPIARWEFVTGKFLGLALCVFVTNFAMGLFFLGIIYWQSGSPAAALPMFAALSFIYLELLLVIAMATFFSTFCTPLMSMIFSFGMWLVGHLSFSFELLKKMAMEKQIPDQGIIFIANFMSYLMPDLAKLTQIRSELLDASTLGAASSNSLVWISIYILAYVVALLSISTIIAERREFN